MRVREERMGDRGIGEGERMRDRWRDTGKDG